MGRKVQSERRKAGVGGGGRGRLERPPLGALQALGRANLPGVLGQAKEPRDPQLRHGAARISETPNSATEPPCKARCHFRFVERLALAIPRHAIPESQAHSRCSINAKGTNACVREPGDSEICGSSGGSTRRPVAASHGLAPSPPLSGSPAPRAGPSRPQSGRREPPAGCTGHAQTAARSRSERASVLPARATYLGALRPRMLQVWKTGSCAGRVRALAAAIADTRGSPHPHPVRDSADTRED